MGSSSACHPCLPNSAGAFGEWVLSLPRCLVLPRLKSTPPPYPCPPLAFPCAPPAPYCSREHERMGQYPTESVLHDRRTHAEHCITQLAKTYAARRCHRFRGTRSTPYGMHPPVLSPAVVCTGIGGRRHELIVVHGGGVVVDSANAKSTASTCVVVFFRMGSCRRE